MTTIAAVETTIANVGYKRAEVSSIVVRQGLTDVIVKIMADDGTVGWGEACSGPDVESVEMAVQSMIPFLTGADIWNTASIRADIYRRGLWHLRPMTANFSWAGIDMALWDLRGKLAGLPVYKLLGGALRDAVDYFYLVSRGDIADIRAQCEEGVARGYTVFYTKAGMDFDEELGIVETIRDAIGPKRKIRLDINGGWSSSDAIRNLERMAVFDIDFVEQPVPDWPPALMAELRRRSPVPLAQNEGMWTTADATMRMLERTADVYTFSPYWVGGLEEFQRLSLLAHSLGFEVCKHTHGELGIAAAASQQVLLTLPNVVDGNQQTESHHAGGVLAEPPPIAFGPHWGISDKPGLGIDVDEVLLTEAAERYRIEGQHLPYTIGNSGDSDVR